MTARGTTCRRAHRIVFTLSKVVVFFTSAGEICANNIAPDSMQSKGNTRADLTGRTDVIVRIQRYLTTNASEPGAVDSFLLEVQDATGSRAPSYCGTGGKSNTYACPIRSGGPVNSSGKGTLTMLTIRPRFRWHG